MGTYGTYVRLVQEDTVRVGYDILYRPGTFSYILLSVFIKSNLEHTRPIAKKSCRHDFYHADMIFIMPTWFLSCRHYFLSTNANQIERLCDESVGWSGPRTVTDGLWRFDSRSRFVVSTISSPAIAIFEIHGEDVVWRTASCSLYSILQNARVAGPTADRRSSHDPPQKQSLAGKKRNTTINQWQWQ